MKILFFSICCMTFFSMFCPTFSYAEGDGFEMSAVAQKNFELKMLDLTGSGPWQIPANAIVYSAEEMNLYRVRDGHFFRIDFKVVHKIGESLSVSSLDLKSGDQIVVHGVGFLRIAEIALSGGLEHGHSH